MDKERRNPVSEYPRSLRGQSRATTRLSIVKDPKCLPKSEGSRSLEALRVVKSTRTTVMRCKNHSSIECFPDEILLKIFGYLQVLDLLNCCVVNRRWRELARDNLIWHDIFQKYVGSVDKEKQEQSEAHPYQGYWKKLCITRSVERRNQKVLSLLRKVHLYTGLAKNTEAAIRKAGIGWLLCLVDERGRCYELISADMFIHSMAVVVRWYGINTSALLQIKRLIIYSINPLFFENDGEPLLNGPHQKSLLLESQVVCPSWTTDVIGADNMVTFHMTPLTGVCAATWNADKDWSFVIACFHFHKLVQRCLLGTSSKPYIPSIHKQIEDDIDPFYGNGFAKFSVIRPDHSCDYSMVAKKLNLSWKTDALKGILQNVCLLHLTVLEEREEVFWSVSTPIKVFSKDSSQSVNFEQKSRTADCISYKDDTGHIYMELTENEDGQRYITYLELCLSLFAINQWFGTSYRC